MRQQQSGEQAPSLRQSAIRGASTTIVGQAAKFTIQTTSTIVLARLLAPEDFGLYAMATPMMAVAMLAQDLGLTQAVVTARSIDRRALSTLYAINVGVSLLIALSLVLAAPLLAAFYGHPRLTPIVMVMGGVVVLSGLTSIHQALLLRGLRYGRLVANDICTALAGLFAAIGLALVAPGPLALVISNVVGATVLLGLAAASSGWRPSGLAKLGEVRDLLRFGGGLTGFNITNFVARNGDNVIIGAALGSTPLGYYDRAYKLMLLPLQQINSPISSVMVPLLSRLTDHPERYRAAYLNALRILLLIALPGVVFLFMAADPLIPTLLGEKWRPAVAVFTWLAVAALHQPLTSTIGWLFMSQHRTPEFAKWGVVNAVTCLAAFAAGLPWGVVGVAAAYALSDLFLRAPAVWWYVGRRGPVRTSDFYKVAAPYAAAAAVAAGGLWMFKRLANLEDIVLLAAMAALSYLSFWAAILLTPDGRTTFAELARIAGARRRADPSRAGV